MSGAGRLAFHVSDVRVEVDVGGDAGVRRGLEAVWGVSGPVMPAVRDVAAGVEAQGERGRVWLGQDEMEATPEDALPALEALLYAALPAWHAPPRVLIHAAAVALGGVVVILAGPSGSGKSTLSSALVDRGATYLSDELVVFDGRRLWGIPRAPQFEPIAPGTKMPPWLVGADCESYSFRDSAGRASILPLMRLRREQVALGTFEPARVRLVVPKVGATSRVRRLTPIEGLSALVRECRTPLAVDLGPLAADALELTWNRPGQALAQLGVA